MKLKLIMLMMLAPPAFAGAPRTPTMILNPGSGMQYITPTANGYNVIRLGEDAGITQVMRTGNMTDILSTDAPPSFVIGNDFVDPAIMVEE